ncbi:hypothetical protein D3C87_1886350 [compost metagenome]
MADAVRAAGDLGIVQQQDAHDLTEPQRDNRQIIAAQAQHREPEQKTEECGDHTRQRQALPETQAVIMVQQCVSVSANRIETAVAQYQQTGQPHHHVQAQAQHHVDQRQRGDIYRAA